MQSIIICGASGQIGSYLVNALQKEYNVIQLTRHHPVNSVDALNEDDVAKFFRDLGSSNEVIALVNCIGGGDPAQKEGSLGLRDISKQNFSNMIESNLTTAFVLMREYIDIFSNGNIINISSIYGCVSPRIDLYGDRIKHPGYIAAKSGLIGLTKYIAVLAAIKNVKVNCISPGAVLSTEGVGGSFLEKYEKQCPLHRGVSLDDIYNAVCMLCKNKNITGQNIIIDAGYGIW